MNIAVLGGGYAGLTASYYLRKKGHEVVLYEQRSELGGLATGFNPGHWEWPLERAYHHLFASDKDILKFAKEIGFDNIFFRSPQTASLYKVNNNYRVFPLDTPLNFFRFTLLTTNEKIRAAAVLAALRYSPHLSVFEKSTAKEFLIKTMGAHNWEILWEQLFRKKFGKYAEKILASFFWARISKRTKKLGYMRGGFQAFTDHLGQAVNALGVEILKGVPVVSILPEGERFVIKHPKNERIFDCIISTLPTRVMTKLTSGIFTESYIQKLNSLEYLSALVLILETRQPILESSYWLNIADSGLPLMFVGQHTNFIDPKHYGDNHIAYIGYYLENNDELMRMTKEELINYLTPHLRLIAGREDLTITNSYHWKAGFAQPIFDTNFIKNKPDFITPVKNFYIANLDMTYPYDRGTNYAVALGKRVAEML